VVVCDNVLRSSLLFNRGSVLNLGVRVKLACLQPVCHCYQYHLWYTNIVPTADGKGLLGVRLDDFF